ncbi:SusC/RagA family TonB-linked outer membrane protein [Puteibacter caeruleilacunae]|nr:SusC/RagA family TonB-linked outer membrane protein [Puteibacter caeruleilacunae]
MRKSFFANKRSSKRNTHWSKALAAYFFVFVCSISLVHAQEITVKGKVKDDSGQLLPGVTVVEKGTTNGIVTNIDGVYSINVKDDSSVLVFSFVGMQPQEVEVKGQRTIDVKLKSSVIGLEEVIAVGYGKQSRATITSSIAKVDDDEITATTTSNAMVALQGKVAGLDVRVNSGQPGAVPSVIIRGGSSTSPGNDGPLYVIDGVTRSNMNDLNPEDIETMQVLKDAAAASIYGARAANGVVLITTKGGKKGRGSIILKHGITRSSQNRRFSMSSARDYIWASRNAANQALDTEHTLTRLSNPSYAYGTGNANYKGKQGTGYGNAVGTVEFLDVLTEVEGQGYVDNLINNQGFETMTDPVTGKTIIFKDNHYQDVMFDNGLTNETNLTLQGGNDRSTYYANLGFVYDDGLLYKTGYRRYSLNFNGSYKIFDNLTSSYGVSLSTRDRWGSTNSDTNRSARLPHTVRMYTDAGLPSIGEGGGSPRNILHAREYKKISDEITRYTYRFGLDWEIAPDLHFKPSGSYYRSESLYQSFEKYNSYVTNRPMNNTYNSYWQWMVDGVLTYDKTFNKLHAVNVVAGVNATKEKSYKLSGSGKNAATDNIATLNAAKTEDERVSSEIGRGTIASAFARATYAYDDRYLFTGSVRLDGSSVFAEENKHAVFGAVSAGWNVHKEKFWKSLGVARYISSFKPRVSWGSAGNDNISVSATQGAYKTGYNYLGGSGVLNTTIPNPTLLWESTSSLDIGFDMGLLNNKHTLFFDYYDKRTKDRLTGLPLAAQTGFNTITSNVGTVQNKGFEIGVNAKVLGKSEFKWNVDLTFSMNRTFVLKLPENGKEKNRIGGRTVYDPKRGEYHEVGGTAEGERLGQRWMFDMIGIYQTDAEAANAPVDKLVSGSKLGKAKHAGDANWNDLNKDGIIDYNDLVFEGYANPDKVGSIVNSFEYKGLSLRVVMNYAMGHIIANGWKARMNGNARNRVATSEDVTNGKIWWPQELAPFHGYDPSKAKYPRYNAASDWDNGYRNHFRLSPIGNNSGNATDNNAYVSKGDYLALTEISMSYNLPESIVKKSPFRNVNFQLGLYNLGYLTAFDGLTPEHYGGYEGDVYPRPFQVNFTTKITF